MWKNGSTAITRSSSEMVRTGSYWQRFATRLRWVSMTPLGRPVVPLENGSATRCDAGSIATAGAAVPGAASSSRNGVVPGASPIENTSPMPAARAAASARSASCGTVTSQRAPAVRSWNATSSAV